MNKNEYDLWNKIAFRTISYGRNFDLINKNESFITEHSGLISKIRLVEQKMPILVGEYGYSVWNIEFALKFGLDLNNLLLHYKAQNTYNELLRLTENSEFNILSYKKIVLIHNLVIHNDYRKSGISEEFIESIYRDFSDENTAIIALVKPIQYNEIDFDFYYKINKVKIRENIHDLNDFKIVKASDYYSLNEFLKMEDRETNEINLFALASKCGFKRIGDSYLFKLEPSKIIERMKMKQKYRI
jgi:hypothetical protein